MSKLTDEQLDSLEHSHGMIESEYTPTCRSAGYGNGCPGTTDDSLDFWRRAADAVPAMLAELRERRAADLLDEDVEALRHAHWLCASDDTCGEDDCDAPQCIRVRRALAVLDKLIASLRKVGTP